MRWPQPYVTLEPRIPLTLPDAQAQAVLDLWGPAGVIELPAGADFEATLLVGIQKRHDRLVLFLQGYREEQAARQAAGLEIRLPRQHHRDAMREIKMLAAEIIERDPVLKGELPMVRSEPLEDPLAKELEAFGITPKAAPMVPRVDEGLMDIGGV